MKEFNIKVLLFDKGHFKRDELDSKSDIEKYELALKMDKICCQDGKDYKSDGKQIHRQAVFPERAEKARCHLETNGKDKQDKAEILYEFQHRRVDPEAEMAQENTHEQYPRRTKGYSLDFEPAQVKTRCYDQCQDEYGACRTALNKKIHS